jgi:hypothetical protein
MMTVVLVMNNELLSSVTDLQYGTICTHTLKGHDDVLSRIFLMGPSSACRKTYCSTPVFYLGHNAGRYGEPIGAVEACLVREEWGVRLKQVPLRGWDLFSHPFFTKV